jgi:hypothetical protein
VLLQKWLYGYCFAQLLPIVDNQAQVNFVQNKEWSATQLFPIGALTKEVKEEIWLNYST